MDFKNKSLVWLIIFPIIFLSLHYFVFLENYKSSFSGNESFPEWFSLVSSAPSPIISEKISLLSTSNPNYFQPLRFKYYYTDTNKNQYFESYKYLISGFYIYNSNLNLDNSGRDFAVRDLPNGLFFLTQYVIIITFVFQVVKFRKSIIK